MTALRSMSDWLSTAGPAFEKCIRTIAGQDVHMKSYTSEQGGCQEGSHGTHKGISDFKYRGFAFCKPILYFRVEAQFNRSKIILHLESTLKSTPSKLNGF